MELIEVPKERLNDIAPLWQELNALHLEKSEHHKAHFASFSFAQRARKLLAMEKLVIFAARNGGHLVGYCIASADKGAGEIESIFIKPAYQGSALGQKLAARALAWLENQNCSPIRVCVADGNEAVFPFYEKLGFKKRFQVLEFNGG